MNAFKLSRLAIFLPITMASACAVTATPDEQTATQDVVVVEPMNMVSLEYTPPSDDGGDAVQTSEPEETLEGGNSVLSLSPSVAEHPNEPAVEAATESSAAISIDSSADSSPEAAPQDVPEVAMVPPPAIGMLNFTTDSAEIVADDLIHLSEHAAYLAAHPDVTLVISGHADDRGSDAHNLALSQKRAEAVADALLQFGAPAAQLTIQSFGEDVPMLDRNRWDENRRVELEYAAPTRLTQR